MYEDRKKLYKKIQQFTGSKAICYVTGDRRHMEVQIASDVLEHFTEHLDKLGQQERISLILYSRGGETLAGWSLVQLIRQFCSELWVIVPSKAHSTATLIALGANSILMTKQATLGPIDPSVNGPLNPQAPGPNPLARIPVSVESINGYVEFVRSLGVKNEQQLADIIVDLSSKVHPMVLGDIYRSRSQIRMLGERLLSGQIDEPDKTKRILDFLCSESGSHDYTIFRKEARDALGLNVVRPDDKQYLVIKKLHDDYADELQLMHAWDPNVELGPDQEKQYSLVRGLIESVDGGSTRFVSEGQLRRVQIQQGAPFPQIQEGIQDRRTYEGWKHF